MDVKVGALSSFPPATIRSVTAGSYEIVLIRNSAGVVTALLDKCSHADVELSEGTLEGDEIECPAHGARFDIKSGKALCMPAIAPVRAFAVKIAGDDILVDVPE